MKGRSIFINGLGTVGSRIMRLSMGMDIPVIGAKNNAKEDDIKTKELIELFEEYGNPEMYVVPGKNEDLRARNMEKIGFKVKGSVEDLDFNKVSYIVDASPKYKEIENYENFYKNLSHNFMIQGGGNEEIVDSCYLSAPNAIGEKKWEDLKSKDIKQVSCNTTWAGTATGLILEVEPPENIGSTFIQFLRRQYDPKRIPKNRKLRYGLKFKPNSHHKNDLEKVFKELEGKVESTAIKGPWQHYHFITMDVNFEEPLKTEEIKEKFYEYPRGVFIENGFDMEEVISKTEKIGIPDGDTLLPIFGLSEIDEKTLNIYGLNPQRSVVALSTLDMITEKYYFNGNSWKESFDFVNENVEWYSLSLNELKEELEAELNGN